MKKILRTIVFCALAAFVFSIPAIAQVDSEDYDVKQIKFAAVNLPPPAKA